MPNWGDLPLILNLILSSLNFWQKVNFDWWQCYSPFVVLGHKCCLAFVFFWGGIVSGRYKDILNLNFRNNGVSLRNLRKFWNQKNWQQQCKAWMFRKDTRRWRSGTRRLWKTTGKLRHGSQRRHKIKLIFLWIWFDNVWWSWWQTFSKYD